MKTHIQNIYSLFGEQRRIFKEIPDSSTTPEGTSEIFVVPPKPTSKNTNTEALPIFVENAPERAEILKIDLLIQQLQPPYSIPPEQWGIQKNTVLQRALKVLHKESPPQYSDPGPIDGIVGKKTKAALARVNYGNQEIDSNAIINLIASLSGVQNTIKEQISPSQKKQEIPQFGEAKKMPEEVQKIFLSPNEIKKERIDSVIQSLNIVERKDISDWGTPEQRKEIATNTQKGLSLLHERYPDIFPDPGPADGIVGPKTKAAIQKVSRRNVILDGVAIGRLVTKLTEMSNEIQETISPPSTFEEKQKNLEQKVIFLRDTLEKNPEYINEYKEFALSTLKKIAESYSHPLSQARDSAEKKREEILKINFNNPGDTVHALKIFNTYIQNTEEWRQEERNQNPPHFDKYIKKIRDIHGNEIANDIQFLKEKQNTDLRTLQEDSSIVVNNKELGGRIFYRDRNESVFYSVTPDFHEANQENRLYKKLGDPNSLFILTDTKKPKLIKVRKETHQEETLNQEKREVIRYISIQDNTSYNGKGKIDYYEGKEDFI